MTVNRSVEGSEAAPSEWRPGPQACRTETPEPHLAGEFPMTCYACHLVADS